MKLLRRILYLFNRGAVERDLADEMAAHREMLPEDRRASFGNGLKLREESRDAWGFTWLDQLRQDLAYGGRVLWRSPGYTLSAILVLALGGGINLAMLHLFNAVMFHPLSVRDASTLLHLSRQSPAGNSDAFPYQAVADYREHATLFSYIVAESRGTDVSSDEDTDAPLSVFISGNYFTDLAVIPAYGRLLDARDAAPGVPPVVVLGYRYWQTHFAGDPNVTNRSVRLNGKPVRVVGVTPANFNGLARGYDGSAALWLPVTMRPYLFGEGGPAVDLAAYGTLKPGVAFGAAEEQLRSLTAQLPGILPAGELIRVASLVSLNLRYEADVAIVLALVLLVFLSACANLGNVLLARGLTRQREIDTRVAIGAGRWRVVRQLMTENFLLAVLGTSVAMVVGYAAAKLFVRFGDLPPGVHAEIDWRMALAGAGTALLSMLAFGLIPSLQAVRRGPKGTRARQVLVAVQVAVSCVLIILSSLLTRGSQRSRALDLRFDYKRMVLIDLRLAAASPRAAEITARLEQLPGVDGIALLGLRSNSGTEGHTIRWSGVSPSYFSVMNLPVLRGRALLPGEQNAAVLSESAARTLWPNEDPLGKSVLARGLSRTVVGVVKDSGAAVLNSGATEAYVPISDANLFRANLIVHTIGDVRSLFRDARSAVSAFGLAPSITSMQTGFGIPTGSGTGGGGLMVDVSGGAATILAFIGIFGLIALAVAQRTREIGLRIALGARPRNIVGVLVGQYALALGLGMAAGLILAAAGAQILQSKLYGLAADPLSYAGGLSLFGAIALVAILIPARRALNIDPASALRWE